jgi:hypothetical protein
VAKKTGVKPKKTRLACGVDIGVSGGFGMVCGDEVLVASQVLGRDTLLTELEGDHKRLTAKDKRKPRYIDGTLAPVKARVFDSSEMIDLLLRSQDLARDRGYAGIYVAVESPQLHIGKSHPAGYLVTGGCYHTWVYALDVCGIPWGTTSPTHWKAGMKLTASKLQSVLLLADLVRNAEEISLTPKKRLLDDHNVCEAVLLALWVQKHCKYVLERNV